VLPGHTGTAAAASFVRLETAGGAALRLTAHHHLFVTRGGGACLAVPSSQARVGDLVHVEGRLGASLQLDASVAKSLVPGAGLFNPYTLSGSIVVDGVAASCHSSSALDGAFRLTGVSVPDGYQAAFAPLRAMYRVIGADRMASIEFIIDAVASAANTGTLLSVMGPVASAVAGGAWLAAPRRSE
jgi:hedgehog protein